MLNRIIANLNNSSGSLKSALHPDPEIFTGDNRALLENFLTDLNIKLNMNDDWWATEQKKMGYVLFRLNGKAKAQFASKISTAGVIEFADVNEMITLLKVAFSMTDDKEAAQTKLRGLKQGQKALADFLPEWVAVANKTGFNDEALISQLKVALYRSILVRLSFLPKNETATDLPGYLKQVRATDATLSALDANYTKSSSNGTILPLSNTTSSMGGADDDAMDLSALTWSAKDNAEGRRPKT